MKLSEIREGLARWLSPDLATRADERDRYAADLDRYVTAFREAAAYDAIEHKIYVEQMRKVYGTSIGRNVPQRPIDPAMAATLKAGKQAAALSEHEGRGE
jgi:hypothetical protein